MTPTIFVVDYASTSATGNLFVHAEGSILCTCGHSEEEHSATGECQVPDCLCACYEDEEDIDDNDAEN